MNPTRDPIFWRPVVVLGALLTLALACGDSSPGQAGFGVQAADADCHAPTKPVIVMQPQDQTVYQGQPAVFSVLAFPYDGSLTYQWLRGGKPIPVGGTSSVFTTLPTTLLDDGAAFQVVVTNSLGTITSNEVALHLQPTFTVNPEEMSEATHTFVPADDARYRYIGRIDYSDPAAPVLIWSGTTIKARFHGKSLGIKLRSVEGANYLDAIVDGEIRMLRVTEPGSATYQWKGELADRNHELVLFKRTEAMFSTCAFEGLLIDKDQAGLRNRPPNMPLRIEFYGDSITAGACDEVYPFDNDGDTYNPIGYSSHNNFTAYGALTARMLHADYVAIACSGIGISLSWNDPTMPDVWDRLYYKYDVAELQQPSNRYSFETPDRAPPPDIVVVNLGVNDQGKSNYDGIPFPSTYVERYEKLVDDLRQTYPDAVIILTLGGLSTGSVDGQGADLMAAFSEVVDHFTNGPSKDPRIFSYVFQATNVANPGIHPRDYTHRLMAGELTGFLREKGIVH